jgi:hypothetical protein
MAFTTPSNWSARPIPWVTSASRWPVFLRCIPAP